MHTNTPSEYTQNAYISKIFFKLQLLCTLARTCVCVYMCICCICCIWKRVLLFCSFERRILFFDFRENGLWILCPYDANFGSMGEAYCSLFCLQSYTHPNACCRFSFSFKCRKLNWRFNKIVRKGFPTEPALYDVNVDLNRRRGIVRFIVLSMTHSQWKPIWISVHFHTLLLLILGIIFMLVT